MVEVIPGFSLTNRLLLYASILLTPGQAISGIRSELPINVGFLAYNWYNQCVWYSAIKNKNLHALSVLCLEFNLVYAFTYLGAVTTCNIVVGLTMGFGTAGLLIFNNVAAWTSWATNMPEGYGVYQFFFFGWRRLNPDWYRFFLCWQIFDTGLAILSVALAIAIPIFIYMKVKVDMRGNADDLFAGLPPLWAIHLIGVAIMLLVAGPLVLFVELTFSRNHIESSTDMTAVWLFVAQIGTMALSPIFDAVEALLPKSRQSESAA